MLRGVKRRASIIALQNHCAVRKRRARDSVYLMVLGPLTAVAIQRQLSMITAES